MVKSTSSFALEYTMAQRDVALDWNVMAAYVAPEDLPSEVSDSHVSVDLAWLLLLVLVSF